LGRQSRLFLFQHTFLHHLHPLFLLLSFLSSSTCIFQRKHYFLVTRPKPTPSSFFHYRHVFSTHTHTLLSHYISLASRFSKKGASFVYSWVRKETRETIGGKRCRCRIFAQAKKDTPFLTSKDICCCFSFTLASIR
jgi:hypothetical protein